MEDLLVEIEAALHEEVQFYHVSGRPSNHEVLSIVMPIIRREIEQWVANKLQGHIEQWLANKLKGHKDG